MPGNPATGPQAPGPAAHAGAKPRPRRKTMTPRRPPDEAQRLAALAEFGAMDTPPEHDFDVLVKRLAQVCDVPIALICLVAVPEGVATFTAAHPDVPVYAAALDRQLNADGYILPGLGDAGDRLFGTR